MAHEGEYENAIEHLDKEPAWADMEHYYSEKHHFMKLHYRERVKELYSGSPKHAIRWYWFEYIQEALTKPLVAIEEPLLADLKVFVRAAQVLKRFVDKCLIYIRRKQRKRETEDRQRRLRQYERAMGPISNCDKTNVVRIGR